MTRRDLGLLFLISLILPLIVGFMQKSPGYMDADYYYAGGIRLFQGYGFSENSLWNYLDDPQSLPHPSHGYWYPLASMLSALGMVVTGSPSFAAAKLFFILIGGLIGPLFAFTAYQFNGTRQKAWLAGVLGIFSGFYSPYISTTDNYGVLLVLGCIFLLFLNAKMRNKYFLIGIVLGLMNLARSDSLLWLGLLSLALTWQSRRGQGIWALFVNIAQVWAGYALMMLPWLLRNWMVFGSPLSAAGGSVLWITDYYDTFAWPATRVNYQTFIATGWPAIIGTRVAALGAMIQNAMFAQVGVFNLAWFGLGAYKMRTNKLIQFFLLGWVLLFLLLGLLFPYAAVRGSFFHASASVYPMVVILIVEGVWFIGEKLRIGKIYWMVGIVSILFSVYIIYQSIVVQDWDRFLRLYQQAEVIIAKEELSQDMVIMVSNPAGYSAYTSRPAIIIPNEKPHMILSVAKKFDAGYLLTDEKYCRPIFSTLCFDADIPKNLKLLDTFEGLRIYKIITVIN